MKLHTTWIGAAAVLALGCHGQVADVGADHPLFIRDVLAPAANTMGGICRYTADPAQPTLSIGTLDVALASDYEVEILVGNVGTGSDARFTIEGATVSITDVPGNALSSYTLPISQTLDPATAASPSYSSLSVIAVDAATIASFVGEAGSPPLPGTDSLVTSNGRQQVISNIQIFGKTLGGESVQSDVFQYPIELCLGCLVQGLIQNTCASLAVTPAPSVSAPCLLGQDQPVDCSLCQGAPICQCGALSCVGPVPEAQPDAG